MACPLPRSLPLLFHLSLASQVVLHKLPLGFGPSCPSDRDKLLPRFGSSCLFGPDKLLLRFGLCCPFDSDKIFTFSVVRLLEICIYSTLERSLSDAFAPHKTLVLRLSPPLIGFADARPQIRQLQPQ